MKKYLFIFGLVFWGGSAFATSEKNYASFEFLQKFWQQYYAEPVAEPEMAPNYHKTYWKKSLPERVQVQEPKTRKVLPQKEFELEVRVKKVSERAEKISEINAEKIKVFEIEAKNTASTSNLLFPQVATLESLKFKIFEPSGIGTEFDQLQLVLDGDGFDDEKPLTFDQNGEVVANFLGARVAPGESFAFSVSLEWIDPANVPTLNGSLQLGVSSPEARTESDYQSEISARILGDFVSAPIVFEPQKTETADGVFSSSSGGRVFPILLAAGESINALNLHLQADADDLQVQKITLRETLSGGSADFFIRQIVAKNAKTGQILARARMTNSQAKFSFRSLQIPRGESVYLSFVAEVSDRINHARGNSVFELSLDSADAEVVSLSTGKDLPNDQKFFSLDTTPFGVAATALQIEPLPSPEDFSTASRFSTVYAFKVKNTGLKNAAISRISADVQTSGVDFSEAQLLEIRNGIEATKTYFSTEISGTKITFDAENDEFFVPRKSEISFAIQLKMEDISDSDNEKVSVSLLSDSIYVSGNLEKIQNSAANFIWSDYSQSRHSSESSDWLSGYLLRGLPTNYQSISR